MKQETTDGQLEAEMPETIEHYRIRSVLGYGGMGAVYLAEDPLAGNRRVAIKTIAISPYLPPARQESLRNRLREEAHALGQIQHPGVPTLYHVIEKEAAFYVVMEYVEGESLAEVLAEQGTLSPTRSVEVARSVLDALAAAHAGGLVHRDIKPSNIMLCPDGGVKLIDFGLAKTAEFSEHITRSDASPGTPGYMAPEQVAGKRATPASDLFCVGVVLYEMLAGWRPFQGESHTDLAFSILYEAPVDLRDAAAEVPQSLAEVVMRALAKDPSDRFRTSEEMVQALQVEPDSSAEEPAVRPARRLTSARPVGGRGIMAWQMGLAACLLAALGMFHLLLVQPLFQTLATGSSSRLASAALAGPTAEAALSDPPDGQPEARPSPPDTAKQPLKPPVDRAPAPRPAPPEPQVPAPSPKVREEPKPTPEHTEPPADPKPAPEHTEPPADPGAAPEHGEPPADPKPAPAPETPKQTPCNAVAVLLAEDLQDSELEGEAMAIQAGIAARLASRSIPTVTAGANARAVVRIIHLVGTEEQLSPDQVYKGMGTQRRYTWKAAYRVWLDGQEQALRTARGQSPELSSSLDAAKRSARKRCIDAMTETILEGIQWNQQPDKANLLTPDE
ncbi:MAG: protein kinase domain-containing protein [Planctomycetota bacterium]